MQTEAQIWSRSLSIGRNKHFGPFIIIISRDTVSGVWATAVTVSVTYPRKRQRAVSQ